MPRLNNSAVEGQTTAFLPDAAGRGFERENRCGGLRSFGGGEGGG